MNQCIINLEEVGLEHRDHFIFYLSHEMVIFRHRQQIVVSDCQGNELDRTPCPPDYYKYECAETDNDIVIFLGGKTICTVNKLTGKCSIFEFPVQKLGRNISSIFVSGGGIIFACTLQGKIHLVNYDIHNELRLYQTSSWAVSKLNDIVEKDNLIYLLMDNSFIACCDKETCETLWTRFEAGTIEPKIVPCQNGIAYVCHNILRITQGKEVQNIKVPAMQINSVQGISNNVFLLSQDRKTICSFNIENEDLKWEVNGNEGILETILVKGQYQKVLQDVLFVRTSSYITILNASTGQVNSHFNAHEVTGMKLSHKHILVHKRQNKTDIIGGMTDV